MMAEYFVVKVAACEVCKGCGWVEHPEWQVLFDAKAKMTSEDLET